MSILIQKFGGTSMGSLERIECAADIIIRTINEGHQVVVVVSAMAGETDRLIQLAKNMALEPNSREYAALISTGEQVSAALLSMCLEKKGFKARSFTGTQAGILTDNQYEKARIIHIDETPIREALDQDYIAVVAGFQGVDKRGYITTLGRGGSDTTAVALAACLSAEECQIFTDVNGVYTADPRIEPKARLLETITAEEMLELSSLGSKVLQVRSVEFADKYRVPLRVLSSFEPSTGTRIMSDSLVDDEHLENPIISGITYNRKEAKITLSNVPDTPGTAAYILRNIAQEAIEVDMIVQNGNDQDRTDFTFTVHRDDYVKTLAILDKTILELSSAIHITGENSIAKLSLVGVGMRNHAGVAQKMFEALAQEQINISLISTSEIKISVVIAEKNIEQGIRALHTAFRLDDPPQEGL
jgi:aspartate kinase